MDSPVHVATVTEAASARLRQALTGCTIHPHGPLNAIVAIIDGHRDGTLDGHVAIRWAINASRRQLDELPDGIDRRREQRVVAVLEVLDAGLTP